MGRNEDTVINCRPRKNGGPAQGHRNLFSILSRAPIPVGRRVFLFFLLSRLPAQELGTGPSRKKWKGKCCSPFSSPDCLSMEKIETVATYLSVSLHILSPLPGRRSKSPAKDGEKMKKRRSKVLHPPISAIGSRMKTFMGGRLGNGRLTVEPRIKVS